jgi:hypothetical protein
MATKNRKFRVGQIVDEMSWPGFTNLRRSGKIVSSQPYRVGIVWNAEAELAKTEGREPYVSVWRKSSIRDVHGFRIRENKKPIIIIGE